MARIMGLVRSSLVVIAVIVFAVMLTVCSSRFVPQREETAYPSPALSAGASSVPTNGRVQSSTAGGVTVAVEWAKTEGASLTFNVTMDTHVVDLDQYDLKKLAVLRDDAGKEYRPVFWKSAPGGHHRQGVLTFPLPDSVSRRQTGYVELVIRDVAGIKERGLRWEL